jgi:hypothetical protein
VESTLPLLSRLMEMLANPICPQREFCALRSEETRLLLRISQGEPLDEALALTNEWMFRLPTPPQLTKGPRTGESQESRRPNSPLHYWPEYATAVAHRHARYSVPQRPSARWNAGRHRMPPHDDRLATRALAKVTKEAARAGRDLASLRDDAEVLPMEIRIQLNNAIEEIDLLGHFLHEETLIRVVRKSDAA